LAAPALAQAGKPAPTAPPASGAFPAAPTVAPAPTPAPTPGPAPTAEPAPSPATAPAPDANSAVAPPPPTAAPAPAPAQVPPSGYVEPPPPPPRETDLRPIRARRPFFIGGELGWNGLSGLGVNFSYHPIPYFAIDTGAGLSLTGLRAGVRARANFLTGEWTPFVGVGFSYAGGSNGQKVQIQSKTEKANIKVYKSPFLQLGAGVNYTGKEGFVFTATTGYSILLRDHNTTYVDGSIDAFNEQKDALASGLIVSVAFGYAF
jgi:hypothetical protein